MNENDKKIRKQWLIVLILSITIPIVKILLQMRYDPLFAMFPRAQYASAALSLLAQIGFGYIVYYCAYKKPGTKILTFCLVMTAISLVVTPVLYLSGKIPPPVYIPFYGIYVLVTQGFGVLWGVACWKMRAINKRLQALSRAST